MRTYVTLFAGNYIDRVLALYRSMERHCGEFVLYCLCMDELASEKLAKLQLKRVVPIKRGLTETPKLKKACEDRTLAEQCWTYAPISIWAALGLSNARRVTYLDADTFFFSSPEIIFKDEIDKVPISIVPHRLAPRMFNSHWMNGQYNVNFVTFDTSRAAGACLSEWEADCIQWCYHRSAKINDRLLMGDQAYWNDYAARYPVYPVWHPGVGYAPWSFGLWEVSYDRGPIVGGLPLVQFHAHEFKWDEGSLPHFTDHPIGEGEAKYIYKPYVRAIEEAREETCSL